MCQLSQANNVYAVCSVFELGGITKQLMTGPKGNSEFVPLNPRCSPWLDPREDWVSGKQNPLFPLGIVIKSLVLEQATLLALTVLFSTLITILPGQSDKLWGLNCDRLESDPRVVQMPYTRK